MTKRSLCWQSIVAANPHPLQLTCCLREALEGDREVWEQVNGGKVRQAPKAKFLLAQPKEFPYLRCCSAAQTVYKTSQIFTFDQPFQILPLILRYTKIKLAFKPFRKQGQRNGEGNGSFRGHRCYWLPSTNWTTLGRFSLPQICWRMQLLSVVTHFSSTSKPRRDRERTVSP